jgi:c-di-GMP-binding flagellar brake protein YcgR
MFLDTQPMALDERDDGGMAEFRVQAPAEVRALLKSLHDGNVLVNLNASGTAYTTTIWTLDAARRTLTFSADANDSRLQRLLDADEIVVVAYLDSIKLQFDLAALLLVHGGQSSALQAPWPRVVYRFQRRGSYRVRPLGQSSPMARMRHPLRPEQVLALRIIDVSLGGCALALPADAPRLRPGQEIRGVTIELDAETRFETKLKLHHVTAINPDASVARLGCSMVELPADSERALQRYIDQTQKRRRMMSLD